MVKKKEMIILVDQNNRELGTGEKIQVHKEGKLHRAFSIFIFNSDGELLIQRRANQKYHSGGLWANTCCGHPRFGENLHAAAIRRLQEEMGFKANNLKPAFSFIYKTVFDDGLIEHEYDFVFIGTYNGKVQPDPDEVSEYQWVSFDSLKKDVQDCPEKYVYWLKFILSHFYGLFVDS